MLFIRRAPSEEQIRHLDPKGVLTTAGEKTRVVFTGLRKTEADAVLCLCLC